VAWTRQYNKSRVFYTSLGHQDDFQQPHFQSLLTNAVQWALKNTAASKQQP
jgi:type 1 glutamine amidotransferase